MAAADAAAAAAVLINCLESRPAPLMHRHTSAAVAGRRFFCF